VTSSTPAELLDVASAARLLGVSEKSIRARISRRCLPFRRLGGRVVFRRAELLDFIQKLEGCALDEALANATHGGESAAR
jgi:excisionase family DNA binding protein